MMTILQLITALLSCLFVKLIHAEQVQFYDKTSNFGVALSTSLTDNGAQLLLQVTAPSTNGWVALGSGTMMVNSVMFVMYPDETGKSLVLSVRTTTEHNPPYEVAPKTYDVQLKSSAIKDGRMTANIVWHDSQTVLGKVVDPTAHNQPFIWAVGPVGKVANPSSTNSTIRKHQYNGVMFADMIKAQNPVEANVVPAVSGTSNSYSRSQLASYHLLVRIHAILMGCAFVIALPLGVIGLRLNLRGTGFTIHWIIQCVSAFAILGGLGLGIAQSIIGVKYNKFQEPHQLLGFALCILIGFQVYLGRGHHKRFVVYQKRTFFTYAHTVLGRVVVYGGTTNCILGLLLCGRRLSVYITAGVGVALAITQEVLAIRALMKRRKEDGLKQRVQGYVTGKSYTKLKDTTVTEQEIGLTNYPVQRYQGHGYAQTYSGQ